MSETDPKEMSEVRVDQANLYKEEQFTDLKVATIRRLTPVKQDGSLDKARPVLYVGQTHVMSEAGPIPVQAPIQAASLQEAMERFPAAVERAISQMVAEIEELRRREASRIVVPGPGSTSKLHLP